MSNQNVEASKPQKQMQECFKCKAAGFPNTPIGFEKIGENQISGKAIWKLINQDGSEHQHRTGGQQTFNTTQQSTDVQQAQPEQRQYTGYNANKPFYRKKKVIDIATVTDVAEAKKLLTQGWEYQDSYPATISNVPHYILVRRE